MSDQEWMLYQVCRVARASVSNGGEASESCEVCKRDVRWQGTTHSLVGVE